MDIDRGATTNSYDPPSGLTASRTYAVMVDATGSPDCGVATWATNCRKITILSSVNYGTLTNGDQSFCAGSNDPASIAFSTAPSGGSGTFTYQWYYQDGLPACPTGTNTAGWTLIGGATTNTYDPPTGLTASRTYAVFVDATGSPDCGVGSWASGCRKITVLNALNSGTVTSADETFVQEIRILPISRFQYLLQGAQEHILINGIIKMVSLPAHQVRLQPVGP